MKQLLIFGIAILTLGVLGGCRLDADIYGDPYYHDYTPPAPPNGLALLNGDNRVDVFWNPNYENDLDGYNIYRSNTGYDGRYELVGSTTDTRFYDMSVRNGTTYHYAIAAYDYNRNESELSYDEVYITPRPEGYNQAVFNYRAFPNTAGYSFASERVVPYDDNATDFFFEIYEGTPYIVVYDDTDIQDMGRTQDILDIPFAPAEGWSPTKDEIAKVGHTYVIWTVDNHFAKIRVSAISGDRLVFDWTYQTVAGNVDLKPQKQTRVMQRSHTRAE